LPIYRSLFIQENLRLSIAVQGGDIEVKMPWAPVDSIEIGEITRDVNLSVKVFLSSPTSL